MIQNINIKFYNHTNRINISVVLLISKLGFVGLYFYMIEILISYRCDISEFGCL